ncbi:MAG: DNA primase [Candidatus Paceibacterota bacterium]
MLNSPIEEIKNRLDVVEVIGSYIKVHKTGANYRAVCPFHSEKKPSFFISPARQIWHCFGCGAGHNMFDFVMKIEGVEFGDALRILAQRAGVELKRPTAQDLAWQSERVRLYEICELATKFFEKQLEESKTGELARKYLLGRGLKEESLKKWRLGYAPDVWQSLSDFLTSRGYKKAEVEKAGLGLTSEKGSFYDRFRGRIIFPVFDFNSQVVGFGGRVFKEKDNKEIAKYVNTPSTLLYDKSRILYGLDRAKVEIRKKDNCVLVEGYTDCIMAHQAGTENTVATSGTALTPHQLKILKRYTENLTLGFDMDVAGDSATKRGIDLAQAQGFNIKVVRLPEGKDAAEIISKNPKEWDEALSDKKSIYEFYFESAFSNRDAESPDGKKEISKILLPVIKKIPNQIEKSFWIQKLAKNLKVREEEVREELKKVKLEEDLFGLEPEEMANLPQKSRRDMLEERLLEMILKSPQSIELVEKNVFSFFSPQGREILEKLSKKESPESEFFNYLCLKAEVEEMEENEILSEIEFCLKEIQFLDAKSKMGEMTKEIKKAEEEKDGKKTGDLVQKFKDKISELIKL